EVPRPVAVPRGSGGWGVAIAGAGGGWSGAPAVLVRDEPTATMPANEAARLFATVDRLREQGLGILYVTHHLDEVAALADDVTVLRNGSVVMSRTAAGLTHQDLVTAIVGSELAATTSPSATATSTTPLALPATDLPSAPLH